MVAGEENLTGKNVSLHAQGRIRGSFGVESGRPKIGPGTDEVAPARTRPILRGAGIVDPEIFVPPPFTQDFTRQVPPQNMRQMVGGIINHIPVGLGDGPAVFH